jgi:PAS domain S-box-containing protein
MRASRPANSHYCLVAASLTTAVGIIIAAAITAIVHHSESERLRVRFEDVANHRIRNVEGSLQTCVNHVEAVQALMESENGVGPDAFRTFARHFLNREPYITAIEWVPAISNGGRAASREVFYPVLFSEPAEANRSSVGVDYSSDPERWAAMREAIQTGRPQATRSISLPGEAERSGVQIFMPVYANGEEAASRVCRGLVSARFDTVALTNYALANVEIAGVDVSFYEYDSDGSERVLCTRWSRARPEKEQCLPGQTPAQRRTFEERGYAISHRIKVAGLTWWVSVTPAPAFFDMFETRNWRLVLLAGIALSIVIGYIVLATLRLLLSREERARLHLAAVVESSGDAIYTKNLAGIITSWNRAAEHLFGYSAAEIVGRQIAVMLPAVGLQSASSLLESASLDTRIRQYETVRATKTGKLIDVSLSVSPIRDEHGNTVEAAVIARDITERKHIERMKDDFAHLASHQLRTPLSAVRLYTDMLLDGYAGELSALQREYLSIVSTSTNRMIELVSTLLNISRIDSAALIVRPALHQLDVLLGNVLNEMDGKVSGKQIHLDVSMESGMPEVSVDAVIVHEIYSNLISNAIKYTPPGGTIDVALSLEYGHFVTVIADTGCGIPPDEHERVFSRFYRGSNALQHDQEGSGMGLYLVKALCDLSGCSIAFESTPPGGTTFRFLVPATGMKERTGRSPLESTLGKEKMEYV